MYNEVFNERGQLSNAGGPAVVDDDPRLGRKEWWLDGRRHRADGPAVETAIGTKWWYWRGVFVPEECIMHPKSKAPQEIMKIENVEVRRAWMESYGYEAFIAGLKAKVLDECKDDDMALYQLEVPNDEPLTILKVKNSTPEPNGSYKNYFLRVSPKMKNCREAVASTFQMKADEYAPVKET